MARRLFLSCGKTAGPIRLPTALTEPGPGVQAVGETEQGAAGGKRPRSVLRLADSPAVGSGQDGSDVILAIRRLGMDAAMAAGLAAHHASSTQRPGRVMV